MDTKKLVSVLVLALLLQPLFIAATCDNDKVRPLGKILYSQANLELAIKEWGKKDGVGGAEISDYFCDFVIERPCAFFEAMSKNETVITEWTEQLEANSFFDYGGCQNRVFLECQRRLMIDSLSLMRTDSPYEKLRKRLADKLSAIVINRGEPDAIPKPAGEP